MKNKAFRLFYFLSLFGILLASFYPLAMGVRVVRDMIVQGTVMGKDYPKYIIPYLPVALGVIIGVAIMPLLLCAVRKHAVAVASAVGLGVFLASELMLENWVIVTDTVKSTLESWQMFMCYVPAEWFETRTWRAVDILIGEYSPWFKLHFYAIAAVLILSLLNVFYGFGKAVCGEGRERIRALILQAVSTALFLGLCILACFTAFWRTGEITVSPLSAFLMCFFFIVFGVTMGLFTASFLTRRPSSLVLSVSAAVSSVVTLIMYIGELILLSGHLYRFGNGFLFDGLGALVLAPIDLIVILLSGGITTVILKSVADDKK